MTVAELMQRNVKSVPSKASLAEAIVAWRTSTFRACRWWMAPEESSASFRPPTC